LELARARGRSRSLVLLYYSGLGSCPNQIMSCHAKYPINEISCRPAGLDGRGVD
jgi:hypothetical protein